MIYFFKWPFCIAGQVLFSLMHESIALVKFQQNSYDASGRDATEKAMLAVGSHNHKWSTDEISFYLDTKPQQERPGRLREIPYTSSDNTRDAITKVCKT